MSLLPHVISAVLCALAFLLGVRAGRRFERAGAPPRMPPLKTGSIHEIESRVCAHLVELVPAGVEVWSETRVAPDMPLGAVRVVLEVQSWKGRRS